MTETLYNVIQIPVAWPTHDHSPWDFQTMRFHTSAIRMLCISSPDVHKPRWKPLKLPTPVPNSDMEERSTFFYNPFHKNWFYSIHACHSPKRSHYRHSWENTDFLQSRKWEKDRHPIGLGQN